MIVLGWNRGRKQVFTGSVLGGLGLQGRLASYFGRFRQEFTVPERENSVSGRGLPVAQGFLLREFLCLPYLFGLYGFDWQVGLWPFAVFAL